MCLKYIFSNFSFGSKFTIFSDSFSVLSSIQNFATSHQLVREVQDWLTLLQFRKQIDVYFCWVPSHVGIRGNERADAAAKSATTLRSSHNFHVPHEDFKSLIKFYCRGMWQDHWTNLNCNFKLKSIRPSVHPWPPNLVLPL